MHRKDILGITDMKELAVMIGNLHYETLTELLRELTAKLDRDSYDDYVRCRFKLSNELRVAALCLDDVAISIENAWEISKPFMKNQ